MTGIELKEAITELEFVKDRFYDFPKETGVLNDIEKIQNAIKAINELEDYYVIGTVDECREARERQRAKKPIEYEDKYYACPACDNILMHKWERYPSQLKDKKNGLPYCLSCGQAIDWSDAG